MTHEEHGAAGAGRQTVADAASYAARVAVYEGLTTPPRVEELAAPSVLELIERLSARTYELAQEQGGAVPYTLIREIAENLVHARFTDVVVTIIDDGATVRFSDQGPGIRDKERAFLPGFSTATADMRRHIKGVGSGLPIVKECMSFSGGTVTVEDNLDRGTVVTLRLERADAEQNEPPPPEEPAEPPMSELSHRQKQILSLAVEFGRIGPSLVASELGCALSTAYRDLATLEEEGLLAAARGGKRVLTDTGMSALDDIFSG
jgi:anti-sigma regulatory factor (Ser/Thr protein kinase)